MGAGFLAGFAWPLKRTEPWALGWIDAQAGLAYRTALEQSSQEGDRYGFLQALSAQAERSTKRLELPAAQPWWLPLLAVALSLAVLPAISLPGGLGGGLGSSNGNAPLTPNEGAPPGAQSEADDASEPEASETSAGEDGAQNTQPELERTFDAPGEDTSGEGADSSAENGAEQGGDSETLERYLESLEGQDATQSETPSEAQPNGAERNPFSRGEAQQNQDSQGGEQGSEQSQEQSQDQSEPQQGQGAQQGEQSQQGQQGQQGQQNQGETQDGPQDGQGESSAPAEQTQSPRDGEQQEGGSSGTPSEQEQQAEGEQPQQAQGESEGSQEGQVEEGAGAKRSR